MKRHAYLCLLALAISGCTMQPQETLSERLSGRTAEKRLEVLRLACLNEAEHEDSKPRVIPHRSRTPRESSATQRMKGLCRSMAESYEDGIARPADGAIRERRMLLARDCAAEIRTKLQANKAGSARHADSMAEICREMTGMPVEY